MLTEKEVLRLREELQTCKRPLFLYHDDPDGLASFLLCYRFLGDGRGLPVKAYPRVGVVPFARKVEECGADKVFVLDVAMVDQEFIDGVRVPVVWVDHHAVLQRDEVLYFNPQKRGVNVPTPVLIWQVVSGERPQDLWLATVGSIGDWCLPPFAEQFSAGFPGLLPSTVCSVEEALFDTPVGTLVKVLSFNLKGSMAEVMKSVKALSRVDDPYEILNQSTPRGKLLWKKYAKVNVEYEKLLKSALGANTADVLFVFTYADDALSLTKDVANEVLYRLKKVIVVGREKSGEVRCSLRAPAHINLLKAVEKALVGVQGYGGGHEHACGAAIKKEDFARFLENLKAELR